MKGRINFSRSEVHVTDAAVFTLTDDEQPQAPAALVVAFDKPSREIVLALRRITERVEMSLTTLAEVRRKETL